MRGFLSCLLLFSISCASTTVTKSPTTTQEPEEKLTPPTAKVVPYKLNTHGQERVDNYYWLRERENPEVIEYLTQENDYTQKTLKHTEKLQESLFKEITGRLDPSDESVPYKDGNYYYYSRFEKGKEYAIYARKKGSLEAAEEVILDSNKLAEGTKYFAVGGLSVSAKENIIAFATDTVGRRFYNIRFKNLDTGEFLSDEIPDVTGNVAWANDNKTIFYTKQDPGTLRSYRIYRHTLGTEPSKDELVYEEKDETYSTFVFKTKSKKYLFIGSNQTLATEYRYLDANKPTGTFKVFEPRQRGHEYSVDHYNDRFYILSNDTAKNFRLMSTPILKTARKHWKEVIAHRDDVFINGFEIFKDYLVVSERKNGLVQMRIMPWKGAGEHYIDFGEPAYLAYIQTNRSFDTPILRFGYTSMTTPNSVYDYHMKTKEKTLLKQQKVLGGFDSTNYVTERKYAKARDGKQVPVSIVYRKETPINGKSPLLLYGYGSYGASISATFSSARLSLLDRGFIYAIAHIRGGQEMGRDWYEDGKLLKKMNTFTDFIDVGEFLIASNYTQKGKLFAQGGSAGGLLMGAVINLRPDLFHGVVAQVPFVDVVTTMLDETIPLTTSEYDEWGNPNDKIYYDYILNYSPYDNVKAKAYPNLLVTTGLHDSQVQYWEPAKWVAKLRALKTDKNQLLLHTNMDAGHGGASGRFARYKQTAMVYAFFLDLAGKTSSQTTVSQVLN